MLTARPSSILVVVVVGLALLVLLSTTALAIKERKEKKKSTSSSHGDDILSVTKMLKILMGYGEESNNNIISTTSSSSEPPTELLVIGAGFGRTGTTSYMAALERLGLQSYHMRAALGTPGHMEMWIEYLTELKRMRMEAAGENGGDDKGAARVSREQANKVITGLATAGFDATASFPACIALPDLMERYPNARVVMTVRGDGNGQAWATSILNSVARILPAIQRIPFCWIGRSQRFSMLLPIMWELVGAPINATTFLPERNDLARAYDAWLEHVQSVIAGDDRPDDDDRGDSDNHSNNNNRLLLFAPQHGWKPLCDFISPVHDDVAASCREILQAGEPYPRANETSMVQNFLKVLGAISWTFEHALHILAAVMCVLLFVVIKRRERRAAATAVDKNKKNE
jgi:Sulfotransferase domain